MAEIILKGSSKHVTKQQLIEMIDFCARTVLGRLHNTTEIEVRLKKGLLTKFRMYGSMVCTDELTRSPREFMIFIDNSLKPKAMFYTIAHEITHVRQYARNQLKEVDSRQCKWLGKLFENWSYWNCPWEVEARDFSKQLYKQWLEYKKIEQKDRSKKAVRARVV